MKEDPRPVMVSIRCLVYNHEPYLRQCLDGFVMQQTNFRFEAIVHDDASTDGSAAIIREYAENYPGIIRPILETENQYSKGGGRLDKIMDREMRGRYVAVCEGDDYWTDPQKLQRQFDFMEAHPDCPLCFHANEELYPSGEKHVHRPSTIKQFYSVEDAVSVGGSFMATCSIFYRWEFLLREGRPDFWRNSPIGDLPMMLFYVSKGNLGYIDEVMSVYRMQAAGSWSSRQNTLKKRSQHNRTILALYDAFDRYTDFRYHDVVVAKKRRNMKYHRIDVVKSFFRYFRDKLKQCIVHSS